MHQRDSLVDDKVGKLTISKSRYDHKRTVHQPTFLPDTTGFDKLKILMYYLKYSCENRYPWALIKL